MADQRSGRGPRDAPIMPTGAGIADLEIAREQDAVAQAQEDGATRTDEGPALEESESPPS